MKITLKREVFTKQATFGKMYIDDVFFAYTCEDVVRKLGANGEGKIFGKTAIPAGEYGVIVNFSNRCKRELPLLLNVPFYEGVRIHGGNTEQDSLGCLVIGEKSDMKTKVWQCAVLVNKITEKIKSSKDVKIVIENKF